MAIQHINSAGGVPVPAHPVRLGIRDATQEFAFIHGLRDAGQGDIEVYHSDYQLPDVERYMVAEKLGQAMTGGSDFHRAAKPNIRLGTGIKGNLRI